MGANDARRVVVEDVYLRVGETLYITPFSDTHLDDRLSDRKAITATAAARRDLPHHRALWVGDVFNLVVPGDVKRHRNSILDPETAAADNWQDRIFDDVSGFIGKLGLHNILVSQGNHEDEFLKRYGTDFTARLAASLGCARGGFSGAVDFRLHVVPGKKAPDPSDHYPTLTYRVLYHHGAWGGQNKGYPAAKRFAFAHDGWDAFVYGHNHASVVHPEVRVTPNGRTGRMDERTVHIIDCASFVRSYSDDPEITHYGERKGYDRQPRTAPLIRVTVVEGGRQPDRYALRKSVEV